MHPLLVPPFAHMGPKNRKLLEATWHTPIVQPRPSTTGEMVALVGQAHSSGYRFTETSGNAIDDISSLNLSASGSPKQGRTALGLWDGTAFDTSKCLEFWFNDPSAMVASANTVHDFTTGSFAWMFFFREPSWSPSPLSMITKRAGPTTGNPGYAINALGTSQLEIELDDGTNYVNDVASVSTRDGAWHCCLIIVNRTTGYVYIHTDAYTDAGTSLGSLGSLTNTATFAVGSGAQTASPFQIAGLFLFLGSAAEALSASSIASIWKHGQDPSGVLTTAQNQSQVTVPLGTDSNGELFTEYVTANVDQVPIAKHSSLTNPNKLGLQCARTLTTLIDYSDRYNIGNWTNSNVSINHSAGNQDISPRKMQETPRFISTDANAYVDNSFTVSSSTLYTFLIYVKMHVLMGGPTGGALIAWDNTGGSQLGIQTFNYTDDWAIQTLQVTTNPTQVSMGLRIRIDLNNKWVTVYRVTAVAGDQIVPIYSIGSPATMLGTDYRIAGADGQYIKSRRGEIDATIVCDQSSVLSATRSIIDNRNGNGNEDRRYMSIQSDEKMRCETWNSSGVSQGSVDSTVKTWNAERSVQMRWRADAPIAGSNHVENVVDAAKVGGVTSGWTEGDNAETLYIGQDGQASPANQLSGIIADLTIWNKPT